jgi:hypothetical protein
MATNWITLTGADIRLVLAAAAQDQTNENTAEGTEAGSEVDLGADNRRDLLVEDAVIRIRAAIANGQRIPISVTPDTIPPEAKLHALYLAAMPLVQSMPGLAKSLLIGEDGRKTSFERSYDRAEQFLTDVMGGMNVTYPTDPVGEDGETAVTDDNPLYSAVRYGSLTNVEEADLTTQGPVTEG